VKVEAFRRRVAHGMVSRNQFSLYGFMKTLIIIPARMKATRLPNKPLAMIHDAPMIVQVWRRAMEAKLGDVVVACDGEEIAAAVRAAGGVAIRTDPDHPSGSDRIWEAVQRIQDGAFGMRGGHEIIINLQGDVPTLEPALLHDLLKPLKNPHVDITTLAAEITREEEHTNPSVVKAVLAENGRALYFTRAVAPANDGPRYHHIGVYAYRHAALKTFVSLPPSPLELREKLEQLRALEAGMRIDAVIVDTVPLGVDTPEDLERARAFFAAQ
jgi:3-deoxy-manno-octulosonate cytidylyltransferase (CMP-KDO synthetase)